MQVTETLINKKMIFSTKHIIEINISKTKTKDQTFTDLILGTKEINNEARETKGKITLTMQ